MMQCGPKPRLCARPQWSTKSHRWAALRSSQTNGGARGHVARLRHALVPRGFHQSRAAPCATAASGCYNFVVNDKSARLVKVFYTVTLLVFGAEILVLDRLSFLVAHKAGGSFELFTIPHVALLLLFVSRLLSVHSPAWLWFGLPSICCVLGFHFYVVLATLLHG